MESKYRLFIVSFSDSKKYKLIRMAGDHLKVLNDIENYLNDYLRKEFPTETFAYYTTPKVVEINYDHRDSYDSYPDLNADAVKQIKDELKREIKVMEAEKELDRDAPYDVVSAN